MFRNYSSAYFFMYLNVLAYFPHICPPLSFFFAFYFEFDIPPKLLAISCHHFFFKLKNQPVLRCDLELLEILQRRILGFDLKLLLDYVQCF